MNDKKTLYCVNKTGGVQEWHVWAEGDKVIVEHGKQGGKLQRKETTCTPKNVGRANETTPEQQSQLEAQSKWSKQYDKYYRETVEEARELLTEGVMLAQDYTKHPDYLEEEFYVSMKLDGLRCKTIFVNGEPEWYSRGGKRYPVPLHLVEPLKALHARTGVPMLDGEAYCHGEKLQRIQSCVKKPNELTSKVEYVIFDIPKLNADWEERLEDLKTISKFATKESGVYVIDQDLACKGSLKKLLYDAMSQEYEGLMLRNKGGEYLFQNKRSNDLLKYKEMLDSEAKVIDCKCDKNGQGLFTMEWASPYNNEVVTFELSMNGSHEDNTYEKLSQRIGEWVCFKFQDYTEAGVPTFARGLYFRECDSQGNPIE